MTIVGLSGPHHSVGGNKFDLQKRVCHQELFWISAHLRSTSSRPPHMKNACSGDVIVLAAAQLSRNALDRIVERHSRPFDSGELLGDVGVLRQETARSCAPGRRRPCPLRTVVDQPIFNKIIIITDRVVLDRQLQSTVAGFAHTPGTIVKIDEDSAQLRAALAGNAARIVITTLQKFPVIAEQAGKVAGSRFAVIIDEAHSSTSGEAMKDMKRVLGASTLVTGEQAADPLTVAEVAEAQLDDEAGDAVDLIAESMTSRGAQANLAFFAFTATPKPKTLELFGDLATGADGKPVRVPFHLYSMRQAIEEEFILDVLANYTTYDTYYRLANHEPDDDPDVPTSKASAALARFVSLHPTNLAQKAEIIVEHFRRKTAGKIGGHAKAMVVTRSRLHAVRYKQAIDAYIATKGYDSGPSRIAALVAFSGAVVDPTDAAVSYTEAMMNGFGEGQLPKRFASDDYQVLVVAEKYQTGFDQPLLHTMYVDKKLAGVKAVQTLSRLNRMHAGKTDTFVLDFANKAEEIQDAFEPFFEQSSAAPTDPNLLYTLERTIADGHVIHPDEQRAAVDALLAGGSANQKIIYANVNPAVSRFDELDDDSQDVFREALKAFVRAYSFLAQVMPWTDRDLESLYFYGRALLPLLPTAANDPLPQISDAVLLTHLRTEAQGEEENLAPHHRHRRARRRAAGRWHRQGVRVANGEAVRIDREPQRAVRHEPRRGRHGVVRPAEAGHQAGREGPRRCAEQRPRPVPRRARTHRRRRDRRPARVKRPAVQRVLREARLPRCATHLPRRLLRRDP